MSAAEDAPPPSTLMAAKLARPPARANLVARPRLLARLAAGAPLTTLIAPAGFGKTTLVAAWLEAGQLSSGSAAPDLPPSSFRLPPSAWLSLDPADNDLTRCLTYLIAALQALHAGFGRATLGLLQSPQPPAPAALAASLANELQAWGAAQAGPATLILDDYHVIESGEVHAALASLLERLPAHLRVVITSRAEPAGLPLARWRAQGRLVEISLDELRFTEAEAVAFFDQAMGLALPPEEMQALAARTEGWVAGLQLAALARQAPAAAGQAAAISGTHRYVADYLLAEVYNGQPAAVQNFLREVSFLDRLHGGLCDAVTGRDDSAALLDQLARANLFLTRLDERGQWYRLHQLFQEFLQQQLAAAGPVALAVLQRRAAAWFEHQPAGLGEAVNLTLAAGDTAHAASLLAGSAHQLMQRGEFTALRQWLDRLPEADLWRHPRLGLARVWMLLDVDQPQAAQACLERYSAALDRGPGSPLRAEVLALRAICLAMERQPEPALALAQQAEQAGLEGDPFVQAHVLFSLAAAYKMGHHSARAEQAFRQAAGVAAAHGNHYVAFSCFGNLADIQFNSARLREAEQSNRRALEFAALAPGGEQPFAGWLHWSQARIYCEWDELDAAQRAAERCLAQCGLWGSHSMCLRAHLVLSRVHQARGAMAAARASLDEADHLGRQTRDDRLLGAVVRQRVGLALAERDLDLGQRCAALLPAPPAAETPLNYSLAQARLCLAEGQPGRALEHLRRAWQTLEPTDLVTLRLGVLVLQAIALRARGQPPAALAVLERALDLAAPGGFVRLFLDEGAPMHELLRRVLAQQPQHAEAQRLLAAFARQPAAAATLALTVRERQILRLLAAGLSNRDMAGELVIAEATLKRHVSNLYGKLEAHSRTQALARAAALGLL